MLDRIATEAVSIKNHVLRNKCKYAVLLTATVFMTLQYRASQQWTEFMVEKGIDPMEFFVPEAWAEANL